MHAAARWRPVGTVLVDNGSITQEQLDAALAEQQRTGKKIGEVLISSGAITWLTLAHAIAAQAEEMNGGPPIAPPPVSPALPPVSPPPPPVTATVPRPVAEHEDGDATVARLQEV